MLAKTNLLFGMGTAQRTLNKAGKYQNSKTKDSLKPRIA